MSCFVSGDVSIIKNKLDKNHVIYKFIEEHEDILNLLDKLENECNFIRNVTDLNLVKNNINKISKIIDIIINAESHHKREEDVLFLELQKRDFIQPPRVMMWEHEKLRELKYNVKKYSEGCNSDNYDYFIKRLCFNIDNLLDMLRNHIAKENNVLYPASLEIIKEKDVWEKLKKECDYIGYSDLKYNLD